MIKRIGNLLDYYYSVIFKGSRYQSFLTYMKSMHILLIYLIFYFAWCEGMQSNFRRYSSTKYILLWTEGGNFKSVNPETFQKRRCPQSCYITRDRKYFRSLINFDAIIFNGHDISLYEIFRPRLRSTQQIYIFRGIESSVKEPICDWSYNEYFNRTWTYKLDSDITNSNFVVTNVNKKVIGPRQEMHWIDIEDMMPVRGSLKRKLKRKNLAVAWYQSKCDIPVRQKSYVSRLRRSLDLFGLRLDIFGKCGNNKCSPHFTKKSCWKVFAKEYHFYLAFEPIISEDYVTWDLFYALQSYVVPIVYGGANYTRFMPHGAYLNAFHFQPFFLAQKISNLMRNKQKYYDFFKWRSYYSYHSSREFPESDNYCKLCNFLHSKKAKIQNVVTNFVEWWNDNPDTC